MSSSEKIDLVLFSQHGMIDNNQDMGSLAHRLAPPKTYVVAPNLGLVQTLFKIEPLIHKVERVVDRTLQQYPETPARTIATSLGGVIWVEVLARHPEWWERFESLVLLGSPIGGADLARIIDPFCLGIGMAKYLGQNRRNRAEKITATIPTLVIAGNTTDGGDGTVPMESTKLKHAHFVRLDGVDHRGLKTHPAVVKAIQEFWSQPKEPLPPPQDSQLAKLIKHFRAVPGITDASERNFPKAKIVFSCKDGTSIRTWTNLVGVRHVFVASKHDTCEYAAFTGWIHSDNLQQAIESVIKSF